MDTTQIKLDNSTQQWQFRAMPALWICLAISAAALPIMAVAISSYDYQHGWVSAHFATMARSFAEHGMLNLGGVPVQNNPPLTEIPDAYLNWPPLYPVILSILFAVFGESEIVHHLIAAAINLGIGGLIFAVMRTRGGVAAAGFAAIAFFNAPILARYGHMGSLLHLALFLCIASLWAYACAIESNTNSDRRRWLMAAGAVLFSLSVLTSWEPVLAVPGLAGLALIRRDWRAFRVAILFGVSGAAVVACVFVLYWTQYPYFGEAILERVLMRAGLEFNYGNLSQTFNSPHLIQEIQARHGTMDIIWYVLKSVIGRLHLLGPVGLVGLVFVFVGLPLVLKRRNPDVSYLVFGLASIYGLWAILMSNHTRIHEFQVLLLAPLASLGVGVMMRELMTIFRSNRVMLSSTWLSLALVLGVSLTAMVGRMPVSIDLYSEHRPEQNVDIRFSQSIRDAVEPGAIIAYPSGDMVPVYYTERHVVRSVENENILARYRKGIESLCVNCPIYMAVPIGMEADFSTLITNTPSRQLVGGTIVTLRPRR